jgi:anaerobic selenocysteine-containing dehydrogenase
LPSTILFKPKTQEKFINGMINYIIQNNLYKPQANNIEGFSKLKSAVSEYPITDKIKEVTSQLLQAKNPKLITGWGVSYVNNYNLIISLYNLALLIGCEDGFYLLSEEINQLGAMQLIPQEKSIYEILDNIKMLYIVGEDLLGRYPGYTQLKEKLEKLEFLVVQDLFLTETAKVCNIFLPLLSFLEKDGHIINTEGKIEKIKKVLDNSWIINNEELLNRLSELLNQKKLKKPINITDYYMQESKELKPSFKPTVSVSEILPDIEKKDEYFYLDVGGLMFHSPRLTEYSDILLSLEKGGFVEINSNKKEFNDKVKIVSDYGELEKIELRRPKYLLEENTAFMPAYLSKNGFLLYPSCQIINNIEWFKIPRIKIVY